MANNTAAKGTRTRARRNFRIAPPDVALGDPIFTIGAGNGVPFKLDAANFTLDLNGIPATPNDDQLDGAAKDWYPVGRWVDVSDDKRGVNEQPNFVGWLTRLDHGDADDTASLPQDRAALARRVERRATLHRAPFSAHGKAQARRPRQGRTHRSRRAVLPVSA